MTGFTPADAAALLWFALCWAGYTACADHGPWRRHSISVAMNRERRAWMDQMMARELRMLDTQILGNLLQWHASTILFGAEKPGGRGIDQPDVIFIVNHDDTFPQVLHDVFVEFGQVRKIHTALPCKLLAELYALCQRPGSH